MLLVALFSCVIVICMQRTKLSQYRHLSYPFKSIQIRELDSEFQGKLRTRYSTQGNEALSFVWNTTEDANYLYWTYRERDGFPPANETVELYLQCLISSVNRMSTRYLIDGEENARITRTGSEIRDLRIRFSANNQNWILHAFVYVTDRAADVVLVQVPVGN
jgi:hypothetical protein